MAFFVSTLNSITIADTKSSAFYVIAVVDEFCPLVWAWSCDWPGEHQWLLRTIVHNLTICILHEINVVDSLVLFFCMLQTYIITHARALWHDVQNAHRIIFSMSEATYHIASWLISWAFKPSLFIVNEFCNRQLIQIDLSLQ